MFILKNILNLIWLDLDRKITYIKFDQIMLLSSTKISGLSVQVEQENLHHLKAEQQLVVLKNFNKILKKVVGITLD